MVKSIIPRVSFSRLKMLTALLVAGAILAFIICAVAVIITLGNDDQNERVAAFIVAVVTALTVVAQIWATCRING